MSTSPTAVHFDEQTMLVDLADGRSLRVPLSWFPRLLHATPTQRERVELSRIGLHWEDIDEDISIAGLLAGLGDTTNKAAHLDETAKRALMEIAAPPKVFISYASEDKPFVIPFATALRASGVDAWVNEWEIRAGDSLIQKIFEEGIGKAAVVIVALSRISVAKKWVREELDAAVVNRINQTSRLIPIVIEECEIPIALQATKWIRFESNLKEAVEEVLRTIFKTSDKPPMGSAPAYIRSPLPNISGLDSIDLHVLHAIGERFIRKASHSISKQELAEELTDLNLSMRQIEDSLEILAENHYLSARHAIGHKFALVNLELFGAGVILRHRFPEFDSQYRQISADLINMRDSSNEDIAGRLSLPLILVNHVLDDLESKGLIQMSKSIGGPRRVFEVSARLKRAF